MLPISFIDHSRAVMAGCRGRSEGIVALSRAVRAARAAPAPSPSGSSWAKPRRLLLAAHSTAELKGDGDGAGANKQGDAIGHDKGHVARCDAVRNPQKKSDE